MKVEAYRARRELEAAPDTIFELITAKEEAQHATDLIIIHHPSHS